MPSAKKTELMLELLDTVPRPRLTVAVAFILAQRQRRASGLPDDARVEVTVDVEEFLPTCTVRQLKLLREIALGLEPEMEQ